MIKFALIGCGRIAKRHAEQITKLDGIQAAILSAKLPHLERWNELRISHANYYNQLLNNNYSKPQYLLSVKHVFHLYVIKVNPQKRNDIISHLTKNGVSTAIHYPSPLSEMPIFNNKTTCPNARSVCKSILSLPLFPELSKENIDKITTLLNTSS